jgi:hypothetical protein
VGQSYKKQFRQDAIMYSVTSQSVTFAWSQSLAVFGLPCMHLF